MFYPQRNIILVGPRKGGKSTLCNAIFNQSIDQPSLKKPASIDKEKMFGAGDRFTMYWRFDSLVITDTNGFEDPRYKPRDIVQKLRKMLKNSIPKYEKVIFCIRRGRVSEPTRVFLRLLKTIFDDPASNMILYVSGCEDGTTVDQFIDEGYKDEDLKELIDLLQKQTIKNKSKGIKFENIITGTMQSDQDKHTDERRFLNYRRQTFEKIMAAIETDIGFASGKISWKGRFKVNLPNLKRTIIPFPPSPMISKEFETEHFYGECLICSDDNNNGWIILTPCSHRFHEHCYRYVQNQFTCSLCNADVKDIYRLP